MTDIEHITLYFFIGTFFCKSTNKNFTNLQIINKTWERTDSIKTSQINQQYKMIERQNENIDKLKKSIKVRNTVTGVSLITALLCLLLN